MSDQPGPVGPRGPTGPRGRQGRDTPSWRIAVALTCFAVYQLGLGAVTVMGFHYWDTARKRDCESSMTIREEALANDKAAFRALGRELGASNERTERFITDVIDKNYHDLPKPASCN